MPGAGAGNGTTARRGELFVSLAGLSLAILIAGTAAAIWLFSLSGRVGVVWDDSRTESCESPDLSVPSSAIVRRSVPNRG